MTAPTDLEQRLTVYFGAKGSGKSTQAADDVKESLKGPDRPESLHAVLFSDSGMESLLSKIPGPNVHFYSSLEDLHASLVQPDMADGYHVQPWEMGAHIAECLRKRPIALVLDGVERIWDDEQGRHDPVFRAFLQSLGDDPRIGHGLRGRLWITGLRPLPYLPKIEQAEIPAWTDEQLRMLGWTAEDLETIVDRRPLYWKIRKELDRFLTEPRSGDVKVPTPCGLDADLIDLKDLLLDDRVLRFLNRDDKNANLISKHFRTLLRLYRISGLFGEKITSDQRKCLQDFAENKDSPFSGWMPTEEEIGALAEPQKWINGCSVYKDAREEWVVSVHDSIRRVFQAGFVEMTAKGSVPLNELNERLARHHWKKAFDSLVKDAKDQNNALDELQQAIAFAALAGPVFRRDLFWAYLEQGKSGSPLAFIYNQGRVQQNRRILEGFQNCFAYVHPAAEDGPPPQDQMKILIEAASLVNRNTALEMWHCGELLLASRVLQSAILLVRSVGNIALEARYTRRMGEIYTVLGNHPLALQYAQRAERLRMQYEKHPPEEKTSETSETPSGSNGADPGVIPVYREFHWNQFLEIEDLDLHCAAGLLHASFMAGRLDIAGVWTEKCLQAIVRKQERQRRKPRDQNALAEPEVDTVWLFYYFETMLEMPGSDLASLQSRWKEHRAETMPGLDRRSFYAQGMVATIDLLFASAQHDVSKEDPTYAVTLAERARKFLEKSHQRPWIVMALINEARARLKSLLKQHEKKEKDQKRQAKKEKAQKDEAARILDLLQKAERIATQNRPDNTPSLPMPGEDGIFWTYLVDIRIQLAKLAHVQGSPLMHDIYLAGSKRIAESIGYGRRYAELQIRTPGKGGSSGPSALEHRDESNPAPGTEGHVAETSRSHEATLTIFKRLAQGNSTAPPPQNLVERLLDLKSLNAKVLDKLVEIEHALCPLFKLISAPRIGGLDGNTARDLALLLLAGWESDDAPLRDGLQTVLHRFMLGNEHGKPNPDPMPSRKRGRRKATDEFREADPYDLVGLVVQRVLARMQDRYTLERFRAILGNLAGCILKEEDGSLVQANKWLADTLRTFAQEINGQLELRKEQKKDDKPELGEKDHETELREKDDESESRKKLDEPGPAGNLYYLKRYVFNSKSGKRTSRKGGTTGGPGTLYGGLRLPPLTIREVPFAEGSTGISEDNSVTLGEKGGQSEGKK